MEYVNMIINNWQVYSVAVFAVMGAAAAIAALTPTPKDDSVVAFLRKIVDIIGMNIGNAKNAPPSRDARFK